MVLREADPEDGQQVIHTPPGPVPEINAEAFEERAATLGYEGGISRADDEHAARALAKRSR